MSTCSQAEFARRQGVSRAAVAAWKKAGKIFMVGDSVDIELSEKRLEKTQDSHRGRPRGGVRQVPAPVTQDGVFDHGPGIEAGYRERMAASAPGFTPVEPIDRAGEGETIADAAGRIADAYAGESFDTSKARKERYAGLLNQLKYDQESGLVVPVAEVTQIVGEQLATVRSKLMAIPSEHAPRIARCKTAAEVQDVLLEVVVEALSELTGYATP